MDMSVTKQDTPVATLGFTSPAIYEISVIGNLDRSWSSKLANMQITLDEKQRDKNVYVLIGKLKDQSELMGILNTLYELHLSLLKIEIL